MAWKAAGHPTVQRQRDRWVVRLDGFDTETGKRRPRQIGSYPSERKAVAAARSALIEQPTVERGTVGWLVRRYVESRTDVSTGTRQQYVWAATHITSWLGAIRLDRLDRDDIRQWLGTMAASGQLSKRSIAICRFVLRAALADAVDEGLIPRSPANRVPMPRSIAKPPNVKDTQAWTDEEVRRFLATTRHHRLGAAFRIEVLYGLRRSELLALRWDDLDLEASTIRVDEGLVAVRTGIEWSNGKTTRSRRTIPLDPESMAGFALRRRAQAEERLDAGLGWAGEDLIFTSQTWTPILPRSFDRSLELVIREAKIPRLTSHGLRHTAATHMVANANDLGELQAVSEILGHSVDILLRIYAHALPSAVRSVSDRVGERAG
jgi:integrase